jgi:hypothetical protein
MEEIQIKTERGELIFFNSLKEAFVKGSNMVNLEKISFDFEGMEYRIRPKLKSNKWNSLSEERLNEMSQEYKDEPLKSTKIFWINQLVIPLDYDEKINYYKHHDDEMMCSCITHIFNEIQFKKFFKID